jgi:hypothetical protein
VSSCCGGAGVGVDSCNGDGALAIGCDLFAEGSADCDEVACDGFMFALFFCFVFIEG